MALQQSGTFQTPNASKYLQQLCKHFEHKVAVVFDESEGRAALPDRQSSREMGPLKTTESGRR